MTGSQVDLLTPETGVMAGQITSLQGTEFLARVQGAAGVLSLHARLNIDSQTNVVTGSVDATLSAGGCDSERHQAPGARPDCRGCWKGWPPTVRR